MSDKPIRIDWENTWVRGSALLGILAAAIWGARYLTNNDNAIDQMRLAIAEQGVNQKEESLRAQADREALRNTMKEGFNEVKIELQRISLGSVQTRQADTWIEQWDDKFNAWISRVMLDNPSLKLPAFKSPALPK